VTVIERSDKFGGTSAISGGGMWVANNRFMADLGLEDSRQDAVNYLRAYALGRSPGRLIERFVDEVNSFLSSPASLRHQSLGIDRPSSSSGCRRSPSATWSAAA
jgi:hypothetical protein